MSSTTCPAKRDFTTPLLQDQALRIPGQLQTQATGKRNVATHGPTTTSKAVTNK